MKMSRINSILAVIVLGLALIFVAACKTQQVNIEKTAIETPESPKEMTGEEGETTVEETSEEIAGEEETGEIAEETKAEAEESVPSESNIEVVSKKTITGTSSETDRKIIDDESWFSNVVCGQLFSDGESYLTFTFENKGEKEYSLIGIKYAEMDEKNPLRLTANNHDFRKTAKESCGAETVKAGEKITCKEKLLLRKGKSAWGKELFNVLEANAIDFNTQLKFKCLGIAEGEKEAEEATE